MRENHEQLSDEGIKLLTPLDPDVVNIIPAHVASEFKIIPVERTGKIVRLVCVTPLTSEEQETLRFIVPGWEFEYITDPHILPDIRQNIRRVIEHYYPPLPEMMFYSPID